MLGRRCNGAFTDSSGSRAYMDASLADVAGGRVAEVAACSHTDQLKRIITHSPARFASIHRWLPTACLRVESCAMEKVVL
jgi:hypothetical protein